MIRAARDNPTRLLGADGRPILRAGYDAVDGSHRRRVPATSLRSEDRELSAGQRRSMVATARDVRRNYTVAAWAIRKHLDYVSTFRFHSRTGNPELDGRIERLMRWWSRPDHCDAAGRHSLARLTRLLESHALVDGDVLVLKLADGRVQAIEGDRLRDPQGPAVPDALAKLPSERLVHGAVVGAAGRTDGWCVARRTAWGAFEFERYLPAGWCLHHGYFERLDQVRGVTPLSSALNDFRDLYEGKDYALAKMKISQLFGLIFFRKSAEEMGLVEPQEDEGEGEGEGAAAAHYDVDVGKGPFKLELDPGDDAKWLETGTPASETQAFLQLMIEAALKSVDLPMSFYDGSRTNFFGSRAELNHYLAGAKIKRQNLADVLDALTAWRLTLFVDDGLLALPGGMKIRDLGWQWVHAGLPWWNPVQEESANSMALAAVTTSRQRICIARGDVFDEIVDERIYENGRLTAAGLPTDVKAPNITITEDRTADDKGNGGTRD